MTAAAVHVLLIEDNAGDARLVKEELRSVHSNTSIQLEWADCLTKGLDCLAANHFNAVLLDLNLTDSMGLDTLQQVLSFAPIVPVVVMTGQADDELGLKAVQAGAQDYLIKGQVDGRLLTRVLRYAIQRKQAELDLRASEEKFQNIIRHSSSVFYSHSVDHRLTYVSPQSRTILDCEPEEAMIGWQTFLSDHPLNRRGIEATERAIQTGQRQPPYELEVITRKGRRVWVLVDESPVVKDGKTVSIVGSLTDITERKFAEAALEANEKRFRTWIENSSDIITVVDLHGIIQYQSPSAQHLLGYAPQEVLGTPAFGLVHPDDRDQMTAYFIETIQNPEARASAQCRIRHKDGSWRFMEALGRIHTDEHGELVALINSRDITERKRLAVQLHKSEATLRGFYESAPSLMGITELVGNDDILHVYDNPATCRFFGVEKDATQGRLGSELGAPPSALQEWIKHYRESERTGLPVHFEYLHEDPEHSRWLAVTVTVLESDVSPNTRFCYVAEEITERKRAEEALREKEHLLSEAQSIGHIGSWRYDILQDTITFSDEMYRLLDILPGEFHHDSQDFLTLIFPADRSLTAAWLENMKVGMQSRELNFRTFHKNGELRYLHCKGAVEFGSDNKPTRFIGITQDITERKVAEMQINQQVKRLTSLSEIDRAITSSFDRRYTLGVILSQVISQLQVDAADVLLLNEETQTLEYIVGQGFRTKGIETAQFQMGEGHAGRAAQERRMVRIADLRETTSAQSFSLFVSSEGFISYLGVPLIVKGSIKGVLEVYQRSLLQPYQEWLDFFNTLVGQTVIALENAALFGNLQATNEELYQAYDATIEGWSRAMDLRDRETEGHTQRVTRLTLELARAMGVDESQLAHIRRGALLHDIGKLGVPDQILFKPSPLTPQEMEIMQKHTEWAYEMLAPITYLKPALAIPSCHHEKWDGTGYPLGLKGEQIPLEARIFAVVDVWDALRADRPYRKAWPETEVLAYIQDHSGTHFDPRVVKLFMKVVKAGGES